MRHNSFVLYIAVSLAALLAPALRAQTPTCNGLPATIVATAPGPITGTQGDDVIVGTSGDDRIFGLAGNDTICGLAGNDQITGGQGQDQLFGQSGNDAFFWSPGDGNDRVEGSFHVDTLNVSASNASETVDLSANGNRLRLSRNIGNVVMDVAGVERVQLDARGGSDLIVLNQLAATTVQQVTLGLEGAPNTNTPDGQADSIIVFGSAGDDQIAISGSGDRFHIAGAGPKIEIRNAEGALDSLSIYGIDGNDRLTAQNLAAGLVSLILEGGPDDDTITGSQGSDSLVGGDGNDLFLWTLGAPADRIGGGAGTDSLQVLGSSAADNVSLAATALEVQVMDAAGGVSFLAEVDHVEVRPGRGADQITLNTLAGAAVQKITLDLRPSTTSTAGDSAADTLFVNGTPSADNITIIGSAGNLTIAGLTPLILVQGAEAARDTLTVNGSAGTDVVDAHGLAADVIRLVMRGGPGNDVLTGSFGNDVFTWVPGDGRDVIEGGPGSDSLQFSGANIGENFGLFASGTRLTLTRDIATVALDIGGVERIAVAAQGGADTISFGDLNGTAVKQVAIDLAAALSTAGDSQPDTLQVTALTATPIATTLGAGTMKITWSPVTISVTAVEPANDRFILQTSVAMPAPISSATEPASTVAGVTQ
jgi:Ca2+-binding RTX toxin-like protein